MLHQLAFSNFFSNYFFQVGKHLFKISNKDIRTKFIIVVLLSLVFICNRYLPIRVGFKYQNYSHQAPGTNCSYRKK